jgi:hypothetical protein
MQSFGMSKELRRTWYLGTFKLQFEEVGEPHSGRLSSEAPWDIRSVHAESNE